MIQPMPTEHVRKLLAEAAALPEEERGELVAELARTLGVRKQLLGGEPLLDPKRASLREALRRLHRASPGG
jgi:hypothetical protein